MKVKLIRTSTVPISLNVLLKGQLNFLNKKFKTIAVSSPGKDLEIVKEREGVMVKTVSMERSISPVKDLVSLIKMYILFVKEKPQIVHSITPKAGLISMIAAYLARVPIRMHTFTGLIFPSKEGVLRRILIFMDRVLCFCATNIYPEGEGVKNDLVKSKITKKELKVLANGNVNGIDLEHFNANKITSTEIHNLKKQLEIGEGDFVFVFVGRLVKDKGVNELVESFNKQSLLHTNVKLVLVGSMEIELDPLKKETLEIIKRNQRIISVGYQNDIRPYLTISNVLVLPSYREGFPNVVIQAGAMGLPSIVTDINGANEIIINRENGLIVQKKEVEVLFEAMQKLYSDNELYCKLKENTRVLIESRYDQKVVWNALLNEYQDLLKKNKYVV